MQIQLTIVRHNSVISHSLTEGINCVKYESSCDHLLQHNELTLFGTFVTSDILTFDLKIDKGHLLTNACLEFIRSHSAC